MKYECFDVDVTDHVAQVRMNRPDKANSMIKEFWYELPDIINKLAAGSDARVIVLSGEGRHFSSGMDLSVFGDGIGGDDGVSSGGGNGFPSRPRAASRETILRLQETFSCLERSRIPVIAAIQGACVGGGIDMISACDMRYASADAFFTIHEINIGMTADVGTLQRLPRLIGEGVARDLAFTGRRMGADEAAKHGLINQVFEDADVLRTGVDEIATEIASKSPMAIWGTKQVLNYSRDHSIADGLEYIATWNAAMFDFDDMAEAFEAQKDSRSAKFPDNEKLRDPLV